ncbi:Uncharacterised protein [Streptococcus pneumoniae]|nr:Uncharacterised protein [Streptococcus pneumoniae]
MLASFIGRRAKSPTNQLTAQLGSLLAAIWTESLEMSKA